MKTGAKKVKLGSKSRMKKSERGSFYKRRRLEVHLEVKTDKRTILAGEKQSYLTSMEILDTILNSIFQSEAEEVEDGEILSEDEKLFETWMSDVSSDGNSESKVEVEEFITSVFEKDGTDAIISNMDSPAKSASASANVSRVISLLSPLLHNVTGARTEDGAESEVEVSESEKCSIQRIINQTTADHASRTLLLLIRESLDTLDKEL